MGRRAFERHPVGTGPFVLLRHTRGEAVELARNPAWWDAASGRPIVDRVKYVVYPSVSSRQLAFQRGAVDCAWVQIGQAAAAENCRR